MRKVVVEIHFSGLTVATKVVVPDSRIVLSHSLPSIQMEYVPFITRNVLCMHTVRIKNFALKTQDVSTNETT